MRALLLLHAILGATVVGLLTHHAVWSLRGRWVQSQRYARYAFIAVFLQISVGFWVMTRFAPQTALFRVKVAAALATAALAMVTYLVHRFATPRAIHRALATLAALGAWSAGILGLALLGR